MAFAAEYRALVERLVRELRPEDGVPEASVAAGEQRLGLRLPKVLREFYLLAGNLKRINRAQERLLPPDNPARLEFPGSYDEITIAEGGLVLYLENQGGCMWGIDSAHLAE